MLKQIVSQLPGFAIGLLIGGVGLGTVSSFLNWIPSLQEFAIKMLTLAVGMVSIGFLLFSLAFWLEEGE